MTNRDDLAFITEASVLVAIFGLLLISLNLLIAVARGMMSPRPKYVKPDPLFRSYEAGQNWTWDFCMVFKVQDPDEVVSDYQAQYSLRKIVERLESGGLETKLFKSYSYDKIFMKIRCGLRRLKDQAASDGYACRLDPDEVTARIERGYRDEFGKFKWYPRRREWSLPENPAKKFNTEIVDEKGQSKYAYNDFIYGKYVDRPDLQSVYVRYLPSNSIFRGVDRLKLIIAIMEADLKREGCSLKLRELLVKGAVLAIYPLHDVEELQTIQSQWLTYCTFPWNQPIDLIKDYFGEKVAMYFLFLGTYTAWLIMASLVGIVAYVVSHWGAGVEQYATATMAIFMSLWATIFLQSWKATQARANMEWGMTSFEEMEQNRPDFEGKKIHSPVTGFEEMFFPEDQKQRRVFFSFFQIALCLVYILVMNACVFYIQAYVTRYPTLNMITKFSKAPEGPVSYLATQVAFNVVLALIVQVTNTAFMPFARYMNNEENHRTETEYEDHLIAKVFVFQFVNSYCALFYVAMGQSALVRTIEASQPWKMGRFDCRPFCLKSVGYLLATIFMTRVLVGNTVEVIIPYLQLIFRRRGGLKVSSDPSEFDDPYDEATMRKRQVSPAEEQFDKADYDYLLGTFDDYIELVIQFGYATMFVSAFPLAPVFACVNNYIEIRTDGWKLCQNTRRPWPMGAEDIGTWEDILTIVSIIATITNGIMVTWTSLTFIAYSVFQRLLAFILLEYTLVGAKIILMMTNEDIPEDVLMQIKRQDFLAAKIVANERETSREQEDETSKDIEPFMVHQSDPDVIVEDPNDQPPNGRDETKDGAIANTENFNGEHDV